MSNYGENICQAIDQIIYERLNGLSFDKTATCTVLEEIDLSKGEYKVQEDEKTIFTAFSVNGGVYKVNEQVYVTIPNNDYNNQKIIVGKYTTSSESSYLAPIDRFLPISNENLLKGIEQETVKEYFEIDPTEDQKKQYLTNVKEIINKVKQANENENYNDIIYATIRKRILSLPFTFLTKDEDDDTLYQPVVQDIIHSKWMKDGLNLNDIENFVWPTKQLYYVRNGLVVNGIRREILLGSYNPVIPSNATHLALKAKFKNNFFSNQKRNVTKGNFGVYAIIKTDERNYEINLDSSEMSGNPYSYEFYLTQSKIFDIINMEGKVENISVYFYQSGNFFEMNSNYKESTEDTDTEEANLKEIYINNESMNNVLTIEINDIELLPGYQLEQGISEGLTIYSTGKTTYSLDEDDLTRVIKARWDREVDNKILTITSAEYLGQYHIHWYEKVNGDTEWKELTDFKDKLEIYIDLNRENYQYIYQAKITSDEDESFEIVSSSLNIQRNNELTSDISIKLFYGKDESKFNNKPEDGGAINTKGIIPFGEGYYKWQIQLLDNHGQPRDLSALSLSYHNYNSQSLTRYVDKNGDTKEVQFQKDSESKTFFTEIFKANVEVNDNLDGDNTNDISPCLIINFKLNGTTQKYEKIFPVILSNPDTNNSEITYSSNLNHTNNTFLYNELGTLVQYLRSPIELIKHQENEEDISLDQDKYIVEVHDPDTTQINKVNIDASNVLSPPTSLTWGSADYKLIKIYLGEKTTTTVGEGEEAKEVTSIRRDQLVYLCPILMKQESYTSSLNVSWKVNCAPEEINNKIEAVVDSINGIRGADQLIVYLPDTRGKEPTSRNEYGTEVCFVNKGGNQWMAIEKPRYGQGVLKGLGFGYYCKAANPEMTLSGHGSMSTWLQRNIQIGTIITWIYPDGEKITVQKAGLAQSYEAILGFGEKDTNRMFNGILLGKANGDEGIFGIKEGRINYSLTGNDLSFGGWHLEGNRYFYGNNNATYPAISGYTGAFLGVIKNVNDTLFFSEKGLHAYMNMNNTGAVGNNYNYFTAYINGVFGVYKCRTQWKENGPDKDDTSYVILNNATVNSVSDKRLKTDFHSFNDDEERFELFYNNLQPCNYKWKNSDDKISNGFVAQDVLESFKYINIDKDQQTMICGSEQENGILCINYNEIVPLNTWQIQKLKKKVLDLETEIQELKKIIKEKTEL